LDATSIGAAPFGAQLASAAEFGAAEFGAQPIDPAPEHKEPEVTGPGETRAGETGTPPSPASAPPGDAGAGDTSPARRPSLSPSRAGDFLACPLLYRYRVIDRLPEPPSAAAARGTLVHAVLERLFDEPAAERTPETARALLAPQWERLIAEEPELAGLFSDDDERSAWLREASDMVDRYFTLEDPTRLEPRHREHAVEAFLESGLLLRGYIDRLDVRADGEIRIVDYKTGTAPREEYEAQALFQMKFYAVVLWLTQRRVPKLLQLIYLGNGEIVRYAPDESDLRATVRKIDALWRAIERARATGDWRPRQSKLCNWCAHQAICPAFGGTPPPLPEDPRVAGAAPPADVAAPRAEATAPGAGAPAPADAAAARTAVPAGDVTLLSPSGPAQPPPPEIPAQPAAPEEIAALHLGGASQA
jgi:putative RecB family exonuclease